jgi:FtsZ-interacting cell division protein ZipA
MNFEEFNPNFTNNSRARYWKFVVGFLAIMVMVFVALWGMARYERYTGEQQEQKFADAVKQLQQDDADASTLDTYGGKTPQETLQMYITALQSHDFALAAKYFINDNQAKEAVKWNDVPESRIISIIADLSTTLKGKEDCDAQRSECVFHNPILVDLRVYPNGIWKLIEI